MEELSKNLQDQVNFLKEAPPELLTEIKGDFIEQATSHTNGNILDGSTFGSGSQSEPFKEPGNAPGQPQGSTLNAATLIDASTAVNLFDIIVPTILSAVLKSVKGRQVAVSRFQARASEKETIKPVLQMYLQSINFNVDNPFNALLIVCAVVYGPKMIEILNEAPPVVTPAPPVSTHKPLRTSTMSADDVIAVPRKRGTFSSTNQPVRRGRPAGTTKKK